eukprot:g5529.t1
MASLLTEEQGRNDQLMVDDYVVEASHAARSAGNLAMKLINSLDAGGNNDNALGVISKGGIDLVTAVDKKCEENIFQRLRKRFPDHCFIGEESSADSVLTDKPTWCVDPIDGTTNFVHALTPLFAISIGLLINKKPVMGVIYLPASDEMFQAGRGYGAFLNGRQIFVDNSANLSEALIASNFGHSRDPSIVQEQVSCVHGLMKENARSIRMLGSCCVSMAYTAAAKLSCYYELNIGGIWDIAAGACIIAEAGGVVTSPLGIVKEELETGKQKIICGNNTVVQVVSTSLAKSLGKR